MICEHRLEDVIPMANRLVILDHGTVIADSTPGEAFGILRSRRHPMLHSMPTPMRIWSSLNWDTSCPLTVSDGRSQLTAWAEEHSLGEIPKKMARPQDQEPCMTLEEVWFRYEKDSPDILKIVSMKAYPGELLCILGGNGTGKSTTLSVLSGVRKPYRGKMVCKGKKVAALPQNPQMLLYTSLALDLSDLYHGGDFMSRYGWLYAVMFLSFGVFAACISRKSSIREQRLMQGKLSARTKATILLSLMLIPLTIWAGLQLGGGRKYMLVSLAIIFETMLPFFLIFEGRKPQARELVILSVLSALAIGGRAVFFALPGFKPVAAMVILTGVAFGAEAGFMVGAMTMFCSNVLFGQGPWTPWQMFAMGVMGLLAGVLFRKGLLHRERFSLSVFGGLVTFLIYGGIMNPASVLMYQANPDWKMIITAYITGVPADAIHALATAMFLWFLAEPMLEKLDRVKVKYGLIEK